MNLVVAMTFIQNRTWIEGYRVDKNNKKAF